MPRLGEGFGDGVISVRVDQSGAPADTVRIRWANEDGEPLDGYTVLAKRRVAGWSARLEKANGADVKIVEFTPTDEPAVLELPRNLLVPVGAAGLLITAENEAGVSDPLFVPLPQPVSYRTFGKPVLEFQTVSDLHIDVCDPERTGERHTAALLADVAEICPDSACIAVTGDIADNGDAREHDIMLKLAKEAAGTPPVYYVIGDHDFGFREASVQEAEFKRFASVDSLSYDKWIGGYHFIFLASDKPDTPAVFSDEKVAWLREKLAENADPARPIFVFCHEAVENTVAGSSDGEGWWGIRQSDPVVRVLAGFPQAILYSGHSHWELCSPNEVFFADGTMCHAVNAASIGYLWTGLDLTGGEHLDGAEAIYTEVYADGSVLIRGRDVVRREWTASAQILLN